MKIRLGKLRRIIREVLRRSSGSALLSEASDILGDVVTFNHNYPGWDLLTIDPDDSILATVNEYIATGGLKRSVRVKFTVTPLVKHMDRRTGKVLYKCKVTTPKDFDRTLIVNNIDHYMMNLLQNARAKQMNPVSDKKLPAKKKKTAVAKGSGPQELAIYHVKNDQGGTAVLYDVNALRGILEDGSINDLTVDDISPAVLGCISADAQGAECGGKWAVDFIKAKRGVNGGILYRAGYAMSPGHTLMPDRDGVSSSAAAAWKKAFEKSDISKSRLPTGCEEPALVGKKDFDPDKMGHLQYAYTMQDDSEFQGLVSAHENFVSQISSAEAEALEGLLLDNAGAMQEKEQDRYFS